MAKKVRSSVAEAKEEEPAFEFPEFDERAFLDHEFEVSRGMLIALGLAVVLGLVAWAIVSAALPLYLAPVVGIAGVTATYWIVRVAHPRAEIYTKGEWATLYAVCASGWLAFWFLLLNVLPVHL